MALYRDTEIRRATLKKISEVILEPEEGAHPLSWREVTFIVPDEPKVAVSAKLHPEDVALDRFYRYAPWYPNRNTPICLRPGQWLAGMSEVGIAQCTLMIEYHVPESVLLEALQSTAAAPKEE